MQRKSVILIDISTSSFLLSLIFFWLQLRNNRYGAVNPNGCRTACRLSLEISWNHPPLTTWTRFLFRLKYVIRHVLHDWDDEFKNHFSGSHRPHECAKRHARIPCLHPTSLIHVEMMTEISSGFARTTSLQLLSLNKWGRDAHRGRVLLEKVTELRGVDGCGYRIEAIVHVSRSSQSWPRNGHWQTPDLIACQRLRPAPYYLTYILLLNLKLHLVTKHLGGNGFSGISR